MMSNKISSRESNFKQEIILHFYVQKGVEKQIISNSYLMKMVENVLGAEE